MPMPQEEAEHRNFLKYFYNSIVGHHAYVIT